MCGISGFWDVGHNLPGEDLHAIAARMAKALIHRGPDDSGVWADRLLGVALSHRRLSILDLSPSGHQPMASVDGRFTITFNGEIYNYLKLRDFLASCGHTFRGNSDTEVMLAAFSEWGVTPSVKRFSGMFAFALWDAKDKILYLARDRFGEKPLYYGTSKGILLFGSELKALRTHPAWEGTIDRCSLLSYVRDGYVSSPLSPYKGIYKLTPGTIIMIASDFVDRAHLPDPIHYWTLQPGHNQAQLRKTHSVSSEDIDTLQEHLTNAVRDQMVADVAVGAFLSGGIDSSTIVALMQSLSRRPIKTFTIGFENNAFNEAHFAKQIARHLGTDHNELYVSDERMLSTVARLPVIFDEPFSDPSQIPTILVSELARRQVTVSLSGDAGDELFGGYSRYRLTNRLWRTLGWVPGDIRRGLSYTIIKTAGLVGRFSTGPRAWTGRISAANKIRDRALKFSQLLNFDSQSDLYRRLMSHWLPEDGLFADYDDGTESRDTAHRCTGSPNFLEQLMLWDSVTYLPDDILVKLDRAGMAVGLETRVPLLDYRVVEHVWSLPPSLKTAGAETKSLLRQVLYRFVPREMFQRPKMGFGVPLAEWLRGPLREWMECMLDKRRIVDDGFFNYQTVIRRWEEHLTGSRDWHYCLWSVAIFQAWLTESKSGSAI